MPEYYPRQSAHPTRLQIATKRTGRNHLSMNRWMVQGSFFAGATFVGGTNFLGEFLDIGMAGLSAGSPLEMSGRRQAMRSKIYFNQQIPRMSSL
jgi:hypothetical protein